MYENTPFCLKGRSALVTGGSRGLGREMAKILARAGAEVAICARNVAGVSSAARDLASETGSRVEGLVADVGRRSETERLAKEAIDRMGRIDILFCNAGWNIPQPADAITDEAWDALVELNLTSAMVLTRALSPGMMERKWGRIIYTSSIMALASTAERPVYSATKAALNGMMRANCLRLGAFGITVNCICPGPFATEMPMSILSPDQQKRFADRTALLRWGQPHELAPAALLLASDGGGYITGSVLVVDGGVTIRMF